MATSEARDAIRDVFNAKNFCSHTMKAEILAINMKFIEEFRKTEKSFINL